MIKLKTLLIITIGIIFFACNTKNNQQIGHITTKYTELRKIMSEEIKDTFYVYIRLPKNYSVSNKRYPVLYLLDGDISFNMAVSVVRYLQFGKDIPDLILVAPAYGTLLSDCETNFRERDYTIRKSRRFPEGGGAAKYLKFLKKELIAHIDSNYRTSDMRILNGYSLGGLMAIYTLLEKPFLFDNYIAGSPYIKTDLSFLSNRIKNLSLDNKKKKIFISIGELEDKNDYYNPTNSVTKQLGAAQGIEIKFEIFKNGTHFTCPPEALAYGLKFIFSNDNNIKEL